MQQPKIILSHESFNSIGSWAITPILASSTKHIDNILSSSSKSTSTATTDTDTMSNIKWLILCEDQSIVDLKVLIINLKNEDYTKVSRKNRKEKVVSFQYISAFRILFFYEIY